MAPNSNDNLNNLGKVNGGQYEPPRPPPPPVVGGMGMGGMDTMGNPGVKGGGVRNVFCCVIFFFLLTGILPFVLMSWIFANPNGIMNFAINNFAPEMGSQMTLFNDEGEQTFGSIEVDQDVKNYDPVEGVDQAQSYAGEGAQLTHMLATFVRSDGTMDLTASYNAKAQFYFVRELAEPPEDAPPIGAGGSLDNKWYEPVTVSVYQPGQTFYTKRMGDGYSFEGDYKHMGMDKDESPPISKLNDKIIGPPECEFADLWQVAIEKGAPKDAVAVITYDDRGYEFQILDIAFNLVFNPDCSLNEDESRFGSAIPAAPEEAVPTAPMETPEPYAPPKAPLPPKAPQDPLSIM